MSEAKFHKAVKSFGDGFGYVSITPQKDYRTGDLSETVSSRLDHFELDDGDSKEMVLGEFISMLTRALNEVPVELRDSTVIRMNCSGEYGHASLEVGYTVEEPSDVRAARVEAQRAASRISAKKAAANKERKEREELARLKAKYETRP